jgi:hypothetical protein
MVIARRRVTSSGNRTRLMGCFGQFRCFTAGRTAIRPYFLGRTMTDREKWDRGVAAVREEYAALSPLLRTRLKERSAAVKSRKKSLHSIVEAMGAGEICAECRGECCDRGKNHVTVIDLLVYLSDDRQLFTPCFERDLCPYLGENGCLMEPEYRPYNCITFICERVEGVLEPAEQERFYAVERELRALCEGFEQLFDNRFRAGLLINSERDLVNNRSSILRGAALLSLQEGC